MIDFLKAAGWFIIPLGFCSLVGIFIVFERLYALRRSAIIPPDLAEALVADRPLAGGTNSVLARVISFAEMHQNDEDAVKAFARLELNRMERGFVYLEIIVGAAPLIGLLGTVVGLYVVFGNIAESGVTNQAVFNQGIALALVTTVLGLIIAIPCLVGSGYLQRRVEVYAVQLETLIERLLARQQPSATGEASEASSASREFERTRS